MTSFDKKLERCSRACVTDDIIGLSTKDGTTIAKSPKTDNDTTRHTFIKEEASQIITKASTNRPTRTLLSLAETVLVGKSKRADFALLPERTALLIIDVQDFLSKPTTMQEESEYFHKYSLPRAIVNIQKLLRLVREKRDLQSQGCEVIFTYLEALTKDCRDISLDYKLSGPKLSCLPNSATSPALFLSDLMPRIQDGKGDILVPKTSCSVFLSTNLNYLLRNLHIEQLIITGQLIDQCVESAVRDAADLGYFVTVVDDACAAMSKSSHQRGLLGMNGFCRILNTDQVMEELSSPTSTAQPRSIPTEPLPLLTQLNLENEKQRNNKNDITLTILPVTAILPLSKVCDAVVHSIRTALRFAGVNFLRFIAVDAFNSIRCKMVPLDQLTAETTVAIAKVCLAGLPTFGDIVLPGTGLDAKDVVVVYPDYGSLRILPYANKTAVIFGTVHDVPSGQLSSICTRGLLLRVMETANKEHGITFNVGAELEFNLFDITTGNPVDYSVFANATTLNQQESFLTDCYVQLRQQSIEIEQLHAESRPGQLEVVIKYQPNPLALVDQVMLARETIQAVARQHNCLASFLPKIFADKAGNGLHLHLSFGRSTTTNVFPNRSLPCTLSPEGQSFLEGILKHLKGLLAVTLGSCNSFRRVGPGCWTGHQVAWDIEDKEVPLRVCMDAKTGALTNVEFKLSDSTSNLYLSLACILGSGLEGISKEYILRPSLKEAPPCSAEVLPCSYDASLSCLEEDLFLTEQIMGKELLQAFLAVRRAEVVESSKMTLEQEAKDALKYNK